ncbi:reverse transcriptase domain-containing protein [Tanacetum coccineum]|uniref:Reverse transcriptase domain-containing protein n=1 Tax=Tanacetum coccineum TaxID=301880 RepID=A0ABQ5BYZ5_9ASTR
MTVAGGVVDLHGLKQGMTVDVTPSRKLTEKSKLSGLLRPLSLLLDGLQRISPDTEGNSNAGATYQRLVDKAFDSQVGQNMEVYVDDLVIKSHAEAEMLRDIDETFRTIKPCPNKTEAVLQLPSPRTIKEVQSLNGKLVSLIRFLSKSVENSLPLFKTLKRCIKKSDFHWTPEAEQAFKQLKQHLSELPLLVAPKPKEELIMYLSTSYGAISAVLMTERGTVQTPVYFVSRALQGPELNYTLMEKLVLSLVFAAKETITKMERYAGRTQYHIPPTDVGERTNPSRFSDGSGAGLILTSPKGAEFTYALRGGSSDGSRRRGNNMDDPDNGVPEKWELIPVIEEERQTTHKSQTIRIVGRDSLQAVIPKAVAKMCQTTSSGLLGCTRDDIYVQRLSNTSSRAKKPSAATNPYHGPVAIEAKVVATITGNQVKKFVWDNIVCRFGLPGEIISDNGKQFSNNPFKDWCDKLNITQQFASVKHPQSNGLVERAKRSLGEGIKARLGERNKTRIRIDGGKRSPFSLAHRTMNTSSAMAIPLFP